MKVGGGGREQFMVMLPLLVAAYLTMYSLGGFGKTMAILERMANDGWNAVHNFLR